MAARYLGGWQDANDTFRDAVDADPQAARTARAPTSSGRRCSSRSTTPGTPSSRSTRRSRSCPTTPTRTRSMARVKLEQSTTCRRPSASCTRRCSSRTRSTRRARVQRRAAGRRRGVCARRARRRCDQVLAVNPEDRARRASSRRRRALLHDDIKGFEAERDRVLAGQSARVGVLSRRGRVSASRSIATSRPTRSRSEALQDRPEGLGGAGGARHRICCGSATTQKGSRRCKKAWERRSVQRAHLQPACSLFEDVIPKELHARSTASRSAFGWRQARRADPDALRQAAWSQREYAELVKRYGFTPEGPLTIELYAEPRALRGAHRRAAGARGARRHLRQGHDRRCRRRAAVQLGHDAVARGRRTSSRSSCRARACRAGSPRGCPSTRPRARDPSGRGARTPSCIARSPTGSCSSVAELNLRLHAGARRLAHGRRLSPGGRGR